MHVMTRPMLGRHRWLGGAALFGLVSALLSWPAAAGERPAVVELFTSQGCSSCPPANANLARLSERPGIVALSFGVTYWDRLGWKDTFARPDYTARQAAYEGPLGEPGPFTPQIVIGGRASVVGHDLAEIERQVARDRTIAPATSVRLTNGSVALGAGSAPARGADVWLVRFDPRAVAVPIGRGENGGRTLSHKNVVRDLSRIGTWTGAPLAIPIAPASEGLRTAILVQASGGGPILAAAAE